MKRTYIGTDLKVHTKERVVYDSPDTLRCPTCKGEYDREILDSTVCPRDGAKLKPAKEHYTKYDE